MANPTVVVDFVADTSRLSRGVRDANKQASGFGSSLKSLGKTAGFAAGAAGIAGLTAAVKIGVGEYAQSQRVLAQTNAVLKSTGGVANVTAKDVGGLAEALMKKSGVDDEAIASGENVLLTFTNIRNEVGKGNDIFNQTTKAALDMSVALGTDMTSASMQLGKALNDPIKGMTKLQRSGVTFTDAQKKQVEALVNSGHTLKAQKIILAELNKEFGGSAEAAGKTLPGQLAILRESFNNMAGELIGKLIPYLKLSISWLRDHWPEIQKAITDAWAQIRPVLTEFWQLAVQVATLVIENWDKIKPMIQGVTRNFTNSLKIMIAAARLLTALLRGDWSEAWTQAKRIVTTAVNTIKTQVTTALTNVKAIVTGAWNVVKSGTRTAWDGVKALVGGAVEGVKRVLRGLVEWLGNFAGGIFTGAVNKVAKVFDKIGGAAHDAFEAVKKALNGMIEWLGGILDRVGAAATRIANALKAPINLVIRALNAVKLNLPKIDLPSVKIAGHRIGGGSIGGYTIDPFPNIPELATGGVVSSPTLALVGEGRGREIVAPEALLREVMGARSVNVRVFIGNQELRGLIRTEVDDADTGLARTLLAGRAG